MPPLSKFIFDKLSETLLDAAHSLRGTEETSGDMLSSGSDYTPGAILPNISGYHGFQNSNGIMRSPDSRNRTGLFPWMPGHSNLHNSSGVFPDKTKETGEYNSINMLSSFGQVCDVITSTGMLPGNAEYSTLNSTCLLPAGAMLNDSINSTNTLLDVTGSPWLTEWKIAFLLLVLTMIVTTFTGNTFVILSIRLERRLRTPTNYLTLSLAVTDLLVAVLVMPLSVVNVLNHDIVLIPVVCHLWIILDVNLCSVSIFHLLVIALDRYRSVSNINYQCKRSTPKILGMIAICWCLGLVICCPLIFGVSNPDNDPSITGKCLIDQSIIYTLFSTLFAFYIPAMAMVSIYYKIYRIAKSSIRKTYFKKLLKTNEKEIRRSSAPECLNSSKRRRRTSSFFNIRYPFGRSRGASLDSSQSHFPSSRGSVDHVQCNSPRQSFASQHAYHGNSRTSLANPETPRPSVSSNGRWSKLSVTFSDTDSGCPDCRNDTDDNQENGESHTEHHGKVNGLNFKNNRRKMTVKEHEMQIPSFHVVSDNNRQKISLLYSSVRERRDNFGCSRQRFGNHRKTVCFSQASFDKHRSDTSFSRGSVDGQYVSYSDSGFVSGGVSSIETKTADMLELKEITRSDHKTIAIPNDLASTSESRASVLKDRRSVQMFTIGNHTNFKEKSTIFPGYRGKILNLAEEKRKHELRRERRAARTLGIITGTFIICWLPFFIVALISPLIKSNDVTIPPSVHTFVLWLGYFNCLANPIIYTVFNEEFRKSFKKLLFCKYGQKRSARFH